MMAPRLIARSFGTPRQVGCSSRAFGSGAQIDRDLARTPIPLTHSIRMFLPLFKG